jgi:hypothetical protein
MNGMFANPRYVTRGIAADVELHLQMILWKLIDSKTQSGQQMDYLQIFELEAVETPKGRFQRITHRQEQPSFKDTLELYSIIHPINLKVWAIDDGENSTMLLPEEY